MKLRSRIILLFTISLAVNIVAIWFGLTFVLDSISSNLMKKHAESIALNLEHTLVQSAPSLSDLTPAAIKESLLITKHVSDESNSFDVSKILLIGSDLKVLVGYPDEETGADYSSHEDIRNAFLREKSETVVESSVDTQGIKTSYIDVVLWFNLTDGTPLVLEVKLDFARSILLLENQYQHIESAAIAAAIALLAILLGVLLVSISRTAIRPVQRITLAMQNVGKGNLDVRLDEGKKDEFGVLSTRFNEMVAGLKEKEGLYHYVSQSTVDAVRSSVRDEQEHVPVRRNLALFFSDVRGFTTFSESRDPEVVIGVLNKILSAQSKIIKAHSGDIDKFVGDEVMAIFSRTLDAAEAALEIQSELGEIKEELLGLQIGIGIHEGTVLQGDVGSGEIRDFTVIGDAVNTAARLESVAGPGEILVSEDALRSLLKEGTWTGKPKGELRLKGKNIAIKTFALSGRKIAEVDGQTSVSPETTG